MDRDDVRNDDDAPSDVLCARQNCSLWSRVGVYDETCDEVGERRVALCGKRKLVDAN